MQKAPLPKAHLSANEASCTNYRTGTNTGAFLNNGEWTD